MTLVIIECLAVMLTIIMQILFSKKNKNAWILSVTLNGLWFYIGMTRKVPVIMVATVIYFVFNIKGYLAWRKDDITNKT